MAGRRRGVLVVGLLVLLIGITIGLEGANVIVGTGMSGDSGYVYIGVGLALIGLLILLWGIMSKRPTGAPAASQPSPT